jgi:hypothetical protein
MEELSEWLFDSVQQFLSSPLWFNPIQTFIDENCVVFDSGEENQFIYTLLHQQVIGYQVLINIYSSKM